MLNSQLWRGLKLAELRMIQLQPRPFDCVLHQLEWCWHVAARNATHNRNSYFESRVNALTRHWRISSHANVSTRTQEVEDIGHRCRCDSRRHRSRVDGGSTDTRRRNVRCRGSRALQRADADQSFAISPSSSKSDRLESPFDGKQSHNRESSN